MKLIKANFYLCLLLTCLIQLLACNDKVKIYPNVYEKPDSVTAAITHPGMLHLDADFNFVKQKVDAGEAPWKNAFEHLTKSQYAQSTWTAHPVKLLARLDYNNWHETYPEDYSNYTYLMRDAAAAYQLSLRWKISGDDKLATAAIQILNAWASTCTGYIVNNSGDFIDPNEYLISIQIYQLANAAEILRTFDGWAKDDFDRYKQWMVDVFYPHLTKFLSLHGDETACPLHYWLNWDLATMTGILSIGILNDNQPMINEVVNYFKKGVGSGNIKNAVPYVFQDPDSPEQLGQCQESGRDQGHATLCVSLMGVLCQMAKNAGIDLFKYDNNRALAMCEYVGKYNYGNVETRSAGGNGWMMSDFVYGVSSLPYTTYSNCTGNEWPSISFEEHKNGNESRGTVRPAWELIHRLASDYGLSDIYTKKWVAKMRENTTRDGSDGGAGDYGPNSGGFDQLGYGTLMFAK